MPKQVLTFQYRIKDSTSAKHLSRMASAVNFVWNYCNEASMLAFRRDLRWPYVPFLAVSSNPGRGQERKLCPGCQR